MTNEQLTERLDSLEKQLIGIQDMLEATRKTLTEKEPEIPDCSNFAEDEFFYAVDAEGNIYRDTHSGENADDYDAFTGFHTREMAVLFKQKAFLLAMMLHCKWHLEPDWVPDWDDVEQTKWCVRLWHFSNYFSVAMAHGCDDGLIHFSTEETAQKCADWLNRRFGYERCD